MFSVAFGEKLVVMENLSADSIARHPFAGIFVGGFCAVFPDLPHFLGIVSDGEVAVRADQLDVVTQTSVYVT